MPTVSYYQINAVTIDMGGQMMPNVMPMASHVGQTIDGRAQDLGPVPMRPPVFPTSGGLPMPSMPMPAVGMAPPAMMLAPPRPQRSSGDRWAMASTIVALMTLGAVLFG